ncbi:MAG: DUF2721 domain-containing protein [Cytophagales bacterium]|jgi:hypothetical protein|nr:MAG: II family cellulose-binding protein [Flammeovirgaceae bacterium TMED32]|tara:strand:- start:1716 stop:2126 length:411 start_codon:yes stop_codon:yes gene_type:complete
MVISINIPALLFPAISLLLLAYTNRFLVIAQIIRELHKKYLEHDDKVLIMGQIKNLRRRLTLIRDMQILGVLSFFFCVLSMIFIFSGQLDFGSYLFGFSLILLLASLIYSLRELQISTKALDLELSKMELGRRTRF